MYKPFFLTGITVFLLLCVACKFEIKAPVLRTEQEKIVLKGKFRDIRYALKKQAMALKTTPGLWESTEICIDEDGEFWSLVENAKGRPLRRNKALSGLNVKALGWISEESHFFEIDSFKVQFKKKWIAYKFDPVLNLWRPVQNMAKPIYFKYKSKN